MNYTRPLNLEEAIQKLKSLNRKTTKNSIEIGFLISVLRDYGMDSQEIADIIGVSKRQIYIQLNVWNGLKDKLISLEDILELGIRKAREVLLSAERGFDIRERMTIREIQSTSLENLRRLAAGKEALADRCVAFYFTERERDLLYDALLDKGATRAGNGLVNKSEALLAIITGTPMGVDKPIAGI